MSIFVGSNEISSIYVGSTEVQTVYKGSDVVWQNAVSLVDHAFANGGASPLTVNFDAAVQEGDLLLVMAHNKSAYVFPTLSGDVTGATIQSAFNHDGSYRSRFYTASVGASPTSFTLTATAGNSIAYAYYVLRNAAYSTHGVKTETSSADIDPPSVTGLARGAVVLLGAVQNGNRTLSPSGVTNFLPPTETFASAMGAIVLNTDATTYDIGAFTGTGSNDTHSISVVVAKV